MAKYYSVFGTNGCGVVDAWGRVEKAQKYLKSPNNKRFDNFSEAEAHALNKLKEFVAKSHIYDCCVIPERLKLNELVFTKNLIKQDEPEKKIAP